MLLFTKNIKDFSSDYRKDTAAEFFEKWFRNYLLKNIPTNSVIVMDKARYHSHQIQNQPNRSAPKTEIQKYLLGDDIYFKFGCNKDQLLHRLKAFNIEKQYGFDNLNKQMSHTLLRLPSYQCVPRV